MTLRILVVGAGIAGLAAARALLPVYDYLATRATATNRLAALAAAAGRLSRDFCTWRAPCLRSRQG